MGICLRARCAIKLKDARSSASIARQTGAGVWPLVTKYNFSSSGGALGPPNPQTWREAASASTAARTGNYRRPKVQLFLL
jgi:hypothetical protein